MTSNVRRLVWIAGAIAVVYAASYGATRLFERRQLYLPGQDRKLVVPQDGLELPIERIEIITRDSVTLVGWVIRHGLTPASDSVPWLLICHGSAGNIALPARRQHYAALRQLGLNILAFDYRGYGESGGQPSEEGFYRDADAAYQYLRQKLGVPASRIILFGHSLGSGVAIDLAARVPAAGVIVEGAFTSLAERAQELYPWAPVRWLPVSRFASIEKIDRVKAPKLFLHAIADERIPLAHGRRLYAKAETPKTFVELRGGHRDAFQADSAKYFAAIAQFTSAVTASANASHSRADR